MWEKPFPLYTKNPLISIPIYILNTCWNSYKSTQNLNIPFSGK
ncbi:hypothetical protein LEP1GSC185_2882 [Leptospira licerasiae serovar Varillal str. VAR 010]|uniref:Uncharacterized protein n=1 Tax=Leptospira licerasiae str. MMD4847 TaxID=1049971 RepID=A0ABN0H8U3_9LEPT|nr:hypothetical protein LEP1GSC185_2882 [Leptospira licerasiae serovar Varillal str. VAR 010]EJZ41994.1 hypothetical protein LEP1GSC178_0656 [Leptospira licerasiae str. MMD4847]